MQSSCTSCGCRFSLFKRRHHCRLCGSIFCNDCSSKWAVFFSSILSWVGFEWVRLCHEKAKMPAGVSWLRITLKENSGDAISSCFSSLFRPCYHIFLSSYLFYTFAEPHQQVLSSHHDIARFRQHLLALQPWQRSPFTILPLWVHLRQWAIWPLGK